MDDVEMEQADELNTIDVVNLPVDTVECPICYEPFQAQAPVFQCHNGHVACGGCSEHVERTCPTCNNPIGVMRCRALETIVAAMNVTCRFKGAGCTETFTYAQKRSHEATYCHFAPCECPIPGCVYWGHRLHQHLLDGHQGGAVTFSKWAATVTLERDTPFRMILHEPDSVRVFLVLNGGNVCGGRSLALLSVGPRPAADRVLKYTMVVSAAAQPISLSHTAELLCTRRWLASNHRMTDDSFFFVPDSFWASGFVTVKVTVKKMKVTPPTDMPA